MSEEPQDNIVIFWIDNGTVIDHIPSRHTFKIIRLIDPQEYEHVISVALNLESEKIGKKGLIKISEKILTQEEVNKIALLAPEATVSIIKDHKVVEKIQVKVPKNVEMIVKCPNSNCVTNIEDVKTRFNVVQEKPLKLMCQYCERTIGENDIKLN